MLSNIEFDKEETDMRLSKIIPGMSVIAGATFALLSLNAAFALTFNRLPSLDQVAAEATLAFRGVVETVDYGAAKVSASQTIPYENIRVRVEANFGGASAGQLVLRQMGGPLPDQPSRFLIIPGLSDLAPTDRVYIFANDTKQPFFATLYGDHSLFRVATDESGATLVMNAHWQPLMVGGERIWPVRGVQCVPDGEDRGRCVRTEREVFDVSAEDDVSRRRGRQLTPAMLDRLIRTWRTGLEAPGQSVSASEATFAEALAQFGRAVSGSAD